MSKGVFITGASSGIGKAVAFEMAKKGYRLALAARRKDVLRDIRDEIKRRHAPPAIVIRQLDVTDGEDVFAAFAEMAETLGGIDIVFANAGVGLGERVGRGDFEKIRQTMAVNLLGAMATMDAAAAYFLEKGEGHIVGVSSVAAFRGMPKSAAYCASKAGLAVYMEAMRAELFRKNIHITVLYPGFIDTPLNDMLPSRPFLIDAQKGARIIVGLIEKKVKSATVPVFPWNIVGRLLKILPTGVIARM